MNYTPQTAFDAIRDAETAGNIPVPAASETVHVGTFDVQTKKFDYAVPVKTLDWYIKVPPLRNGKPAPPIKNSTLVGEVLSSAVDLKLTFSVSHPGSSFTVQIGSQTVTIQTQPILKNNRQLETKSAQLEVHEGTDAGVGVFSTTLTIDVGSLGSGAPTGDSEPGTRVTMWCGSASASIQLLIVRVPIVGAGVFNIPALPIALVYAPPPGSQKMNYAEYTTTTGVTTKISTSVSSGNMNKSGTAYSSSDFVDKVGDAAEAVGNVLKAFGVAGADTAAGAVKGGLTLISGIINSTTTSTSDLTTSSTEHDVTTTVTDTTVLGTPAGYGPGVGDRFVYLRNVKVAYLINSGEMSFTVLGHDGIRGFAAYDLLADLAAISTSAGSVTTGPNTSLDELTLQMLLSFDPLVNNPNASLPAPRFIPNDPASAGGQGSDPMSDSISVTHIISTVDISSTVSQTVTVTDFKPGWLQALFGNTATENQITLTYSSAQQNELDQTVTSAVHFFAAPNDPPYIVGIVFDHLFGTFVFTPAAQ